jgi:4-amino-4-deoxy-L-arabinose transferase-like glycosyltransferase
MKSARENKGLIYLFLVSLLTFFPNLWVSRASLMEARNFVTAREMVRDGNWIITTMNGNYRFEKPPLPTWITAFFMKMFNTTSNEYILRLPIAILSMILIFLIYFFVKTSTRNNKLALVSGFVSVTTFMLIKLGNENTWDMFAYIFMFGCISFIFRGLKEGRIGDFVVAGIFMGASLLSKGPVPLYGMLLPFLGAYLVTYNSEILKGSWKKVFITLVIGGIIAVSWPLAALVSQKELFLSIINKEVDTWTTKHTESIFFYLDYIVYIGVWLVFVVASFYKTWAEKKSEDRKFFSFLFLWNLLTLVLLSLIKMKKKRYGAPLYIISPMMASHLINYYLNKDWSEILKKEKIMLKFHFFLMIIISLGIPILFHFKGYRENLIGKEYFYLVVIVFWSFLYCFIEVFLKRGSIKKGIYLTGIFILAVNILTVYFFERPLSEGKKSKYEYLSSLRNKTNLDEVIYTIKNDEITNVWNIGTKISRVDSIKNLPEEFLLLEEMQESEIDKFFGQKLILEEKNTYYKYEDEDKVINLYRFKKGGQ